MTLHENTVVQEHCHTWTFNSLTCVCHKKELHCHKNIFIDGKKVDAMMSFYFFDRYPPTFEAQKIFNTTGQASQALHMLLTEPGPLLQWTVTRSVSCKNISFAKKKKKPWQRARKYFLHYHMNVTYNEQVTYMYKHEVQQAPQKLVIYFLCVPNKLCSCAVKKPSVNGTQAAASKSELTKPPVSLYRMIITQIKRGIKWKLCTLFLLLHACLLLTSRLFDTVFFHMCAGWSKPKRIFVSCHATTTNESKKVVRNSE